MKICGTVMRPDRSIISSRLGPPRIEIVGLGLDPLGAQQRFGANAVRAGRLEVHFDVRHGVMLSG